MAKVPFSKLQASVNTKDTVLSYCNKSGEEIKYEVKSYLPFGEKLDLVSKIINQSIDNNGYYNLLYYNTSKQKTHFLNEENYEKGARKDVTQGNDKGIHRQGLLPQRF